MGTSPDNGQIGDVRKSIQSSLLLCFI